MLTFSLSTHVETRAMPFAIRKNSSKHLISKGEPSHDGHLSKCSSRHDPFTNHSGKHMPLCNLACPKSTLYLAPLQLLLGFLTPPLIVVRS
jgi:hypothetical protein